LGWSLDPIGSNSASWEDTLDGAIDWSCGFGFGVEPKQLDMQHFDFGSAAFFDSKMAFDC
jgi:hypothetical protein